MATNRITLEAQPRTILSKGERNRIRKSGNIPGVIYGRGREPMAITVSGESFKQLRGHGKVLVDVRLAGGETVSAMVQDIAKAKINRETIHIDLNAVNLTEPRNRKLPRTHAGNCQPHTVGLQRNRPHFRRPALYRHQGPRRAEDAAPPAAVKRARKAGCLEKVEGCRRQGNQGPGPAGW